MSGPWSSIRGKALAGIRIGVLSRWVTPGLVDEVLAESGEAAAGRRFRALPGRLGVYLVLGLCLFSDRSCRDVLEDLTAGLGQALGAAGWQVPASTALTGLRRRLGARPFELLFWRLAGPLGTGTAPWSHVGGLLAVAWDGTTVKAPASQANIAAFGRPGGKNKDGHYPQMRLVTLIACGTRALLGAATGPLRGCGERALARELLGQLRTGMLLLADRGFYSYQLWNAAAGTGADLLWRVSSRVSPLPLRELPDGSWLAHVNDPAEVTRRARRNGARRRRGSTRPRPDPAQPHPRPGPPGTMGLPGHLPGDPRRHRPGRGRRRHRPGPDLLHHHAARPAPHRGTRPDQPGHRPGPDRGRHLGRAGPRPPGPRLPPRRHPALLAVPVPPQRQRPPITARRAHHHHPPPSHRTRNHR